MGAEIGAKEVSSETGGAQLPVLGLQELEADPHGAFRRYRKDHAIVRHEIGGYFVLRFADVDRLSRDPRCHSGGTAFPKMIGLESGAMFDAFEYGMMTASGDVHRRRRAPFSRLFGARAIAEMRPHIRRTIESVIDEWHDHSEVEFVSAFASPIPARVIADLFGLPKEDIPDFTRDSYVATQIFDFGLSQRELADINEAAGRLRDYVARLLDERRRNPQDDFLTAFLTAATEAGELSPDEMIYQIGQLVAASVDTTRNAIAIQTSLLLQHPEQWAAVCRDPALVPPAVNEAMRFEPSGSAVVRMTMEDIELDETIIPAGELITLSTMSAMRDERVYDHPDVFDIHRAGLPRLHPIFGFGASLHRRGGGAGRIRGMSRCNHHSHSAASIERPAADYGAFRDPPYWRDAHVLEVINGDRARYALDANLNVYAFPMPPGDGEPIKVRWAIVFRP
jgi:cytochrome P450 family 103